MTQMYQQNAADTAFAVFFEESVENRSESKVKGYPVFEPVEYVEILVPGSKDVYRGPAEDAHKERFAKQYEQFKNKQKQTPSGTPIDELMTVSAPQRATCKAVHVLTVEALADYPDASLFKLGPGGHELKRKAKAFLESRKGAAYATALSSEVEALRTQVAELKAALRKVDGERTEESRQ